MKLRNVKRISEFSLKILNDLGIDATVFANDKVHLEQSAVDELISLMELAHTVERIKAAKSDFFDVDDSAIVKIAVCPDFHKGAGIPIGTVLATKGFFVPQAIGNDVNCGMRLHLTDLDYDTVMAKRDKLEAVFRKIFFEGGRDIPMTRHQRESLFLNGLLGLIEAVPKTQRQGLWAHFHDLVSMSTLERIHSLGSLDAEFTHGLEDFLGRENELSRDNQIGSIGGGNHFVELQVVEKIIDRSTAHAWGIRQGQVVVMIHAGSVMLGHHAGIKIRNELGKVFPPDLTHPDNGIFPISFAGANAASAQKIMNAIYNAANFAFANRMFLSLMAYEGLRRVYGEASYELLYDAPHNMVWKEEVDNEQVFVHRKGATPARNMEAMVGTPFRYYGEPVLVPGSMGSSSFILRGLGFADSMSSASHGAGRKLSCGQALGVSEEDFQEFLGEFQIVMPVNLKDPAIALRKDIVKKRLAELKKEAPFAYKGIGPIIETLNVADIAASVVKVRPIMTIKA